MSKKVICIGEALIDFVCTHTCNEHREEEIYLKKPGGAPANVTACIGRLGGNPEFIGAVGKDAFGSYLLDSLSHFNVCVERVQRVDVPTTLAFVTLQEDGEREFIFNRGADAEFIDPFKDADTGFSNAICHFGSATAFLDGNLQDAYFSLAQRCSRDQNFVSFDPNYRVDLWKDKLEIFKAKCHAFFKLANLVKVSEEELHLLTSADDLQGGCKAIHDYGVETIFVTLGSRGCYVSTKGAAKIVPAFKINAIDTTGAGDAFIGAMLYKLATYESIKSLSFDEITDCVHFAQKVSAYVCEKIGAMTALPTHAEVTAREFEIGMV